MRHVALVVIGLAVAGCVVIATGGGGEGGGGGGDGDGDGLIPIDLPDPVAGDPCPSDAGGSGLCSTTAEALVCFQLKYVSFRCGGPNGCTVPDSGGYSCDNHGSFQLGDRCFESQEGGATCSEDAGVRWWCLDGGFSPEACSGGCYYSGGYTLCH